MYVVCLMPLIHSLWNVMLSFEKRFPQLNWSWPTKIFLNTQRYEYYNNDFIDKFCIRFHLHNAPQSVYVKFQNTIQKRSFKSIDISISLEFGPPVRHSLDGTFRSGIIYTCVLTPRWLWKRLLGWIEDEGRLFW